MPTPRARTIEIPIRANYREGLNILEYFIAGKGARKGLADTALRTADSGYLTRRLVDVSQDVIIREDDCGATQGIVVSDIREGNEMIEKLAERLEGRFAVHDIVHPEHGRGAGARQPHDDGRGRRRKSVDAGIEKVEIRSVLCCQAKHGVCAKCYGANLANGNLVEVGEAVGIIAAQSIGEPGTQLTMRTFHTGGIASAEDITQGLPRVEELFESRRPKNLAIMTEIAGKASIDDTKKNRHVVVQGVDENGAPTEKSYLIPFRPARAHFATATSWRRATSSPRALPTRRTFWPSRAPLPCRTTSSARCRRCTACRAWISATSTLRSSCCR